MHVRFSIMLCMHVLTDTPVIRLSPTVTSTFKLKTAFIPFTYSFYINYKFTTFITQFTHVCIHTHKHTHASHMHKHAVYKHTYL